MSICAVIWPLCQRGRTSWSRCRVEATCRRVAQPFKPIRATTNMKTKHVNATVALKNVIESAKPCRTAQNTISFDESMNTTPPAVRKKAAMASVGGLRCENRQLEMHVMPLTLTSTVGRKLEDEDTGRRMSRSDIHRTKQGDYPRECVWWSKIRSLARASSWQGQ